MRTPRNTPKAHRGHPEHRLLPAALPRGLIATIAAYVIVLGGLSALRHAAFLTQAWDLGVFDQTFWNTLHGRFFWNSLEHDNHMRAHLAPFLVLVVPFYAAVPSPYTLLALQTMALAAGASPLYILATDRLDRRYALALTASYLLYPWLHSVQLFDFHEDVFAIPLFLAAFALIRKGRLGWGAAALGLAALTKESAALVVVFCGLALIAMGQRRLGVIVTLASGVYFAIAAHFVLSGHGGGTFRVCYGHLGDTPGAIVANVARHPRLLADQLLHRRNGIYLLKLLAPVAMLPLLAPAMLIAMLPMLALNLLSRDVMFVSNRYQYDALLIPFLFLGVVEACTRLRPVLGARERWLPALVVAVAAIAYVTVSLANPPSIVHDVALYRERAGARNAAVALVPSRGSLSATTTLIPHLTHRPEVYMLNNEPRPPDVVVLDRSIMFPFDSPREYQTYADRLMADGRYHVIDTHSGFYIFERKR